MGIKELKNKMVYEMYIFDLIAAICIILLSTGIGFLNFKWKGALIGGLLGIVIALVVFISSSFRPL